MTRKTFRKNSQNTTSSAPIDTSNPNELIEMAKELEVQHNFAESLNTYERAITKLEKLPSSDENKSRLLEALESSAELLINMDETDKAIRAFRRAISLAPDTGYEKYMNLGQLLEGRESIEIYRKGIKIIHRRLNELDISDQVGLTTINRDLSNGHCAIAEVYMFDLKSPDVNSDISLEIERACEVDASNPHVWCTKATFFALNEKLNEAKESLEMSFSLFWPRFQRAMEVSRTRDMGQEVSEDDAKLDGVDVAKLVVEDITGIPIQKHLDMISLMENVGLLENAMKVLIAVVSVGVDDPDILFRLAVISNKVVRESDPELVRMYVDVAKEVCQFDKSLVDELDGILSGLPVFEEEEGNTSISSEESSEDEKEAS